MFLKLIALNWLAVAFIIVFFIATSILIYWVCTHSAVHRALGSLADISPGLMMIPAVMFSFTAGPIATSLWEKNIATQSSFRMEMNGIRSYIDLAEKNFSEGENQLLKTIKSYEKSIYFDDLPSISTTGSPSSVTEKILMDLDQQTLHAQNAKTDADKTRILGESLRKIHEGRTGRLTQLEGTDVNLIRWLTVTIMAILLQLGVALVHSHKPRALMVAITLTTLTILMPLCAITLALNETYVPKILLSYPEKQLTR